MPSMRQACVEQVDHSFTKLWLTVSNVQLLYITICSVIPTTQTWNIAITIVKLILSTVMCILVMAQFVRDSIQMHRVAPKRQLNRYMSLLIRDGVLYFLVYAPLSLSFLYGRIGLNDTP